MIGNKKHSVFPEPVPVVTQMRVYGLGVVEKWRTDLSSLAPSGFTNPQFTVGAVGADGALLLYLGGFNGGPRYIWLSNSGTVLTNWSRASGYESEVFVDFISSTNLGIHFTTAQWPNGTNIVVQLYSFTGNTLSSFSTNLIGTTENIAFGYQKQRLPGYPILALSGSILHCYAIEGPELAGSISLSDAVITTNGGISFHATAFTESPSRLQASPDSKTWTDVGTLYPHVETLVTAPVTNHPATLFRAVERQ